jgi:hypothetical protein
MCLGGVAKYLSYLERGKSVPQLIGDLCFSYNAPLIAEFHKLYRSLFRNSEEHIEIVQALAQSRSGLSYQELAKRTGLPAGGTFSKRLEELIQSGFIMAVPSFGQSIGHYLLIDEYSLFYLAWNAGISSLDLQHRGSDYWVKQRNTQSWKSWTGHAFECLCLKHIEGIKQKIGIAAVQTSTSKWKYLPPRKAKEPGVEIDLVIDRTDHCINLCEMKFYDEEFIMTKDYADRLRKKKACFERITNTRKSTFITLITTYGAKHNEHYLSVVDQEINMDALFLGQYA